MKMVWAKIMVCLLCFQTIISGADALVSEGKEVQDLVEDEYESAVFDCSGISDLDSGPVGQLASKKSKKRIRRTIGQKREGRENKLRNLESTKEELEARIEEVKRSNQAMIRALLTDEEHGLLRNLLSIKDGGKRAPQFGQDEALLPQLEEPLEEVPLDSNPLETFLLPGKQYQISFYPGMNPFQQFEIQQFESAKSEPSISKTAAQLWWEAYHPGQTYPEQPVKANENKNELENAADKEQRGE